MVRLCYFICLFLTKTLAFGQDSTVQYQAPRVILKLAPLALLLDPDATIQGGLEVRVSRRSSAQAEVGFGHKGMAITSDEKKNFADWSIWRVRSEWRHYTNRFRTNNRNNIHIRSSYPLGNYLAIEGFAKQIDGTKNLFSYDGTASIPNGQQAINRFVWGSHVKWGRQIAIPGASITSLSRVLLDFYIGVGFRHSNTETTPPDDFCGCGFGPDRFRPGNAIQPSATAGLKIGFGL